MELRPPRSKRTDTSFPYTTLFDLSTRLQVGLAGRRLGRHQGAADDVEDEALGIGELLPGSVDAVVVRIARGAEAGGRLRRGVAPGLHRRQVGIDRVVGVADAVVELRPATPAGRRDGCLALVLVAGFGMEPLACVGRHANPTRPS